MKISEAPLKMESFTSYENIENSDCDVQSLLDKFNEKLREYEERDPTARLWVQYFRIVDCKRIYKS